MGDDETRPRRRRHVTGSFGDDRGAPMAVGDEDIPRVWRFVIALAMKPDSFPRNS